MKTKKSNLAVPQSEIVQDTLAATFSRDFCGDFNGCGRKSPAVPAAALLFLAAAQDTFSTG